MYIYIYICLLLLLQQSKSMKNRLLWYDWALCAQKPLEAYLQISHVLFMQKSHALHDDCDKNDEMPVRDHHYWMGILMMLVSKQNGINGIKINLH